MTTIARRAALVLVLLAPLLAGVSPARAHHLAPSLLELRSVEPSTISVVWRTPLLRPTGSLVSPILPARCRPLGRPAKNSGGGSLTARWKVDCGPRGLEGATVAITGLRDSRTSVLVRVFLPGGGVVRDLLYGEQSTLTVPQPLQRRRITREFVLLGLRRFLGGVDSLLFALGLVLLAGRRHRLATTIAAFTTAHSIALAVATLGLVRVPARPLEAATALGILLLASELARPPGAKAGVLWRRPWASATGLGVLYGTGCAGALAQVGLPARAAPLSLLSYNAGIEVGQLLAAVLILAGLVVLRSVSSRSPLRLATIPAYVIGSLAAFRWLECVAAILAAR